MGRGDQVGQYRTAVKRSSSHCEAWLVWIRELRGAGRRLSGDQAIATTRLFGPANFMLRFSRIESSDDPSSDSDPPPDLDDRRRRRERMGAGQGYGQSKTAAAARQSR